MYGNMYDPQQGLEQYLGLIAQMRQQQPQQQQQQGEPSLHDQVGWAPGTSPNEGKPMGILSQPQAQTPRLPMFMDAPAPTSLMQQPDAPAPDAVQAGPAPTPPAKPPLGLAGAVAPTPEGSPMTANTPDQAQPSQVPMGLAARAGDGGNGGFGGLLNGIGKFAAGLGGIYGQGGPGDGLINLGLALAQGGPDRMGNIMRAMDATNRSQAIRSQGAMQALKLQREQAQQSGGAALVKRAFPGMSDQEALAISSNPAMLGEAMKRISPSEAYGTETDADGNLWQINKQNNQRTLLKPADKATYGVTGEDKYGNKQYGFIDNRNRSVQPSASQSTQTQPTEPGDIPPGVDPAEYRKKKADLAVKKEGEAQDRGRISSMVLPHLDRAEQAYSKLAKLNAIGPISASGLNRLGGGIFGTDAEIARQDFEAATKELELLKAQIQMKGQGAITENERRILQMTLPRLDAADPSTGLATLKALRQQFSNEQAGQKQSASPSQRPTWRVVQ